MKTALIVGGTGGLGTEIVNSLKGEYIFDELWLSKDRPDVMDPDGYQHINQSIDLAIYLAGINITKPIEEISQKELIEIFNVNIIGAFNFVKNTKPYLKLSKNPLYIFTSSIMVDHPYPNRTAYASTKAAIEGLSNALAIELGPERISSVCLRLGHLNSLMKSTVTNPDLLKRVQDKTPQNNLIDSKKVGPIIKNIHDCHQMYNGSVVDLNGSYTRNIWPL